MMTDRTEESPFGEAGEAVIAALMKGDMAEARRLYALLPPEDEEE